MNKKIGILYIVTGRYTIFWDEFYKSAEKFLFPNSEKHYFVFSNKLDEIHTNYGGVVHKIFQEKLGWPYDTLMRFEMFLKAEEMLKEMDYLFFFNANMEILDVIKEEDIFDKGKDLFGFKHTGGVNKINKYFPYDRNPESLAYIPMGEGEYYCMGGLNGGKTQRYLQLIHTLKKNIETDLEKGVIALWHDESHINHYFWKHRDEVLILSEKYGIPESRSVRFILKSYEYLKRYTKENREGKIIIRNKSHFRYGGHNYLRGKQRKKSIGNKIINVLWNFLKKDTL